MPDHHAYLARSVGAGDDRGASACHILSALTRPSVYLRVPPGHAKNWGKHCGKYNACGEQVYFVQNDWYNREYAPAYRKQHGDRYDERKSEKRSKNKEGHEDKGRGHGRD